MDAVAIIKQQAKRSVIDLMAKYELELTSKDKLAVGVTSMETSADHKIDKVSSQKDFHK